MPLEQAQIQGSLDKRDGMENIVFLKEMPFMLKIGPDAWERHGKHQPVIVSIQVLNVDSIPTAAGHDDVATSLDYGKLYKALQSRIEGAMYESVQAMAQQILNLTESMDLHDLSIEIKLPKAELRADGGFIYNFRTVLEEGAAAIQTIFKLQGLKCATVIGVNPHERCRKQIVVVNLAFYYYTPASSGLDSTQTRRTTHNTAMRRSHTVADVVVEVCLPSWLSDLVLPCVSNLTQSTLTLTIT